MGEKKREAMGNEEEGGRRKEPKIKQTEGVSRPLMLIGYGGIDAGGNQIPIYSVNHNVLRTP